MSEQTQSRHPLYELTLSRLREFYREPAALFWTFGFPVLLAVGLGVAFRSRPPQTVEICILGETTAAERAQTILDDAERINSRRCSAAESAAALRAGRVDLSVTPTQGDDGELTLAYRYDQMRAESQQAHLVVDRALQRGLGRRDAANTRTEPVTETGGRYIDFLIPGLIGLNLMSSAMWGIGYPIVLARRRRLLRRLAATPMRRSHFLLAHMFSRLLFLALEVVALLFFGWIIFGVVIHGSLAWVGVISIIGGLSFMGLALMIAARPDNTEVASGWMNAVMLPMWLLSGAFFSYERFPEVIHPLIQLLPLTAFNDALRLVINEGAPFWQTLPQIAVMAVWGTIGFLIALRTFRWQ